MNGKLRLKQCMVTLKELQSYHYTHCWFFARLHGKFIPLKSYCDDALTGPTLETKGIFKVVADEAMKIRHGFITQMHTQMHHITYICPCYQFPFYPQP
jgi:hypothetical protein